MGLQRAFPTLQKQKFETFKNTWIKNGLTCSNYTLFVLFLPVLILQLVYFTGLVQDLLLQFVGGQGMFQKLELQSRGLVQHLWATADPAGQRSLVTVNGVQS